MHFWPSKHSVKIAFCADRKHCDIFALIYCFVYKSCINDFFIFGQMFIATVTHCHIVWNIIQVIFILLHGCCGLHWSTTSCHCSLLLEGHFIRFSIIQLGHSFCHSWTDRLHVFFLYASASDPLKISTSLVTHHSWCIWNQIMSNTSIKTSIYL